MFGSNLVFETEWASWFFFMRNNMCGQWKLFSRRECLIFRHLRPEDGFKYPGMSEEQIHATLRLPYLCNIIQLNHKYSQAWQSCMMSVCLVLQLSRGSGSYCPDTIVCTFVGHVYPDERSHSLRKGFHKILKCGLRVRTGPVPTFGQHASGAI